MDLHDVARQLAKESGADFAFVLSQAGLLVTKDAPRDMPDHGRMKILWACPAGKSGSIEHIEMPRQDLVPYGGAAPVDVFATRVEDAAILVAVLATWSDKSKVVLALTSGAAALAEMIRKAKIERALKETAKANAKKGREDARRPRNSTVPIIAAAEPARAPDPKPAAPSAGARKARTSALPKPPGAAAKKPKPRAEPEPRATPRASSEPEIRIGEASVGRETLFAIEAALPRAPAGPAPEGIRVTLDSISRESLLDVERREAAALSPRAPTVEEPLVVEDRKTLPWVDTPAAVKRTMEARARARAVAPPEIKVGVVEMDPEALERDLRSDED